MAVFFKNRRFFLNPKGMTLAEILLVVSLVSMISIAIYHALSNGLRVWKKADQLVFEEDAAIFFDKLTRDVHNSFFHSKINFQGYETRFSFPTIVHTPADKNSGLPKDSYVDQIGQVEYYFDLTSRNLYRHQANYSQALRSEFGPPQMLVPALVGVKFRYVYLTDDGEVVSDNGLSGFPAGIEVEITFSDKYNKRSMRKLIDIPIGT